MASREKLRVPSAPPVPKPADPNKAVQKPPRLKAIETRNYGKGLTPLSNGPNQMFGAGTNYGNT